MTHALSRSLFVHRGALILLSTLLLPGVTAAQVSIKQTANALEFREVGPAVVGGRIAEGDFVAFQNDLGAFLESEMAVVEQALADAGAPWTPGRRVGR